MAPVIQVFVVTGWFLRQTGSRPELDHYRKADTHFEQVIGNALNFSNASMLVVYVPNSANAHCLKNSSVSMTVNDFRRSKTSLV